MADLEGEAYSQREFTILHLIKYGDNGTSFLSWKAFIVFHSVAHMKSDRNTCLHNENRELEKGGSNPAIHLAICCMKWV